MSLSPIARVFARIKILNIIKLLQFSCEALHQGGSVGDVDALEDGEQRLPELVQREGGGGAGRPPVLPRLLVPHPLRPRLPGPQVAADPRPRVPGGQLPRVPHQLPVELTELRVAAWLAALQQELVNLRT